MQFCVGAKEQNEWPPKLWGGLENPGAGHCKMLKNFGVPQYKAFCDRLHELLWVCFYSFMMQYISLHYPYVTWSCRSSAVPLLFQLCLQDGCAETTLLSRNVQWFQDDACRMCPSNGTITIFCFYSIIYCSLGKIFIELKISSSNAENGWLKPYIWKRTTVGAVLAFFISLPQCVKSCDGWAISWQFLCYCCICPQLNPWLIFDSIDPQQLDQSLAAHKKWILDLHWYYLLNIYYLQHLASFTIVFCSWFEANKELTPAGIVSKAIVPLIALATKADTLPQQNCTWLWYVYVMSWNRHVLIL